MFRLLKIRSFNALTWTQFLGAFNDNAFKQLVLLLVSSSVSVAWIQGDDLAREFHQALPATVFALPFVVLGALTGSLADRVSKTTVIRAANLLEVLVMGVGVCAFLLQSYVLLLATVGLMGAQSALFGPSKYGSIREIVGSEELSHGNALIQTTTMIAILGGTIFAGVLKDAFVGALWIPGLVFVGFAFVGWLISLGIEPLPVADPKRRLSWNPAGELLRHWRATEGNRALILSIIASAFFYLVGATLLLVVNVYGDYLELDSKSTSLLNGMTVAGIGVGALIAGRVSHDRIEAGLVPIGLFGLGASLISVVFAPESVGFLRVILFCSGLSAGLFSIPIRALIQSLPRDDRRGAILGLSEVLDFVGILAAGGVFYLLNDVLALSPPAIFMTVGGTVLAFMLGSLAYTAEFAVRLVLFLVVHTVYRVRPRGLEHLPKQGGALLVANHVSFIDAILIGATSPRPVRFLMFRDFFDVPLVGWFARKMGAMPVSAEDSREAKIEAIRTAAEAARRGELVCIFAEGAITRTGAMLPFARGLERIAGDAGVPILPVSLDRLWGSIFSFEGGRVFWKRPQRIPYPVDISVGEPLPADTPAWEVKNHIQEVLAARRAERDGPRGSLAYRFLRSARVHARRTAIVDSTGARLSYRQLLISVIAMHRALDRELGEGDRVAVLLPPGAAGAIVNVALALSGRASVNLNYTMPNAALEDPIERSGARRVITSRRFLKALKRESPVDEGATLFVEDLARHVSSSDKVSAALMSVLPAGLLARLLSPQRTARETATILFSSGSTGQPKGVVLSHSNVLSNVQSVMQVFPFGPDDAMLGVLPFFHSFGYTVTLWTVLISGAKAVFHTNPLDARTIGDLAQRERVTVTVATPTFYRSYLRRIPKEKLADLRIALSGAERLPQSLADAWRETFGSELLEGYGCTELSPVVSVNLPDVRIGSARQRGNKPGSIGRPLPGVAVRIVDVETRAVRAPGEEGLLEVKGPNVMQGYLDDPERTRDVLCDGWYRTGDVARMDKDGFLTITDRLSRFSKIGGEMVPHGRVEEALQDVVDSIARVGGDDADSDGPEVAVTSLSDEQKGEQLAVLHTPLPVAVDEVVARLQDSDLPRLFLPRPANFVQVDEIPKLGTGKTDLARLKALAAEALAAG